MRQLSAIIRTLYEKLGLFQQPGARASGTARFRRVRYYIDAHASSKKAAGRRLVKIPFLIQRKDYIYFIIAPSIAPRMKTETRMIDIVYKNARDKSSRASPDKRAMSQTRVRAVRERRSRAVPNPFIVRSKRESENDAGVKSAVARGARREKTPAKTSLSARTRVSYNEPSTIRQLLFRRRQRGAAGRPTIRILHHFGFSEQAIRRYPFVKSS